MCSIRSVTRKPPTTLIVPKAIAMTRMKSLKVPLTSLIAIRPPSRTMPWIAFVPDISGVCSVFGIFEITAKPTNAASTRMAISVTRLTSRSLTRGSGAGGSLGALVDDLAVARDARARHDLVGQVRLELALLAGQQLAPR